MRNLRLAAVAAVATGGLVAAAIGPVAADAVAAPAATRYAKVRHLCAAPRPRRATCFVLGLVPARAGAPGASPYLLSAGATTSGPAGGLTPSDLASAYRYSPAAGGSGQTVAIVDAYDDPNIEHD